MTSVLFAKRIGGQFSVTLIEKRALLGTRSAPGLPGMRPHCGLEAYARFELFHLRGSHRPPWREQRGWSAHDRQAYVRINQWLAFRILGRFARAVTPPISERIFLSWPLAFVPLILAIVYMDRLCFSGLKLQNLMKSRFARTGSQKGGA
jgi:hypothetical protein